MRVAFGTVVYDSAYKYVDEYIDSLNKQDTDKFDILLINDDLNKLQLDYILNKLKKKPKILSNNLNLKPGTLRVKLIEFAKRLGYDLLIFGDFDDEFSQCRISSIIKEYDEDYGFFYNELCYFNGESFFYYLPSETNTIDDILDYNYVGLSHSALNLRVIEQDLIDELYESDNDVFDWYLFSILLNHGMKGKKINNGKTYYRLHEQNIAGEDKYSLENVLNELKIKIKHYQSLHKKNEKFKERLELYTRLEEMVNEETLFLKDFIDGTKDYWWSKLNIERMLKGDSN